MYGAIDYNLILGEAQTVGTDGSSEATTNSLRIPTSDGAKQGPVKQMYLCMQVATAFTGGTSIAPTLRDAADDGAGAPDTWATAWTGAAIAVANLTAGAKVCCLPLPPDTREWVQGYYTVTGSMTAGAMDAWLSDAPIPLDV